MSSKQAILIAASICCILLLIFFLFWGGNRDLDLAKNDFADGKYNEAKQKLYLAQETISPAEYDLYMAYIFRGQHKVNESSSFLLKAEGEMKKQNGPLALEIVLNQLLNAYLEHDTSAMEAGLAKAQKIAGKKNVWTDFFRALENYMKNNYKEACAVWKKVVQRPYLSPWMKWAFEQQFSPFWLSMHIVRCEIEEGDYLDARQALQKEMQTASGAQLEDMNFLLGISYAREAQEKSPGAAIPYYKQAFSYFNKVPIDSPRFYYEKQQILRHLQQAAMQLADAKSFQDLTFYVNAMEQWKDVSQMNALTARLIEVLYKEISEKDWKVVEELSNVLNQALPPGNLRTSLSEQFEKLVLNALNTGDLSRIQQYWSSVLLFTANPESAKRRFADLTAQKIVKIIPSDNPRLSATLPYLEFWKEVEQDRQKRYQYALELIANAYYLWANEGESKKALALMDAASKIPYVNEQKLLKPVFEKIFNQLYVQALQEDRLNQLKDILTAIDLFHLTTVPVHDLMQQGNLIEDAQYLYNQGRFAEAEKKVRWVYQLNPSNPAAIKLLGLIDYQNGDYKEALKLLKQVKNKGTDTEEAMAVSEIIAGDRTEGLKQLKKLEDMHAATSDIYLRIGYGMLALGDPQGSAAWFEKAAPKTDEVEAGEEFAAYETHQWQKALDFYYQLTPPYSKLDALQGIAIESLVQLGNLAMAEQILNNMLKEEQEPGDAEFPPVFRVFKKKLLDPMQRDAIAGRFMLNAKKDKQKALFYLSKIPNPSPETLLLKAEVMLSLGNLTEATEAMSMAAAKSKGEDHANTIRKKTLPLMAAIYAHMGYFPEAAKAYQQFFQMEPGNMDFRAGYAKVWMDLQRYDLALKEFQILEKNGNLDADDRVRLIDSLIHLDQFNEANRRTKEWLAQTPSPSLENQLKLARLMVISRNSDVFTQILQKMPDFNRRNLNENIEMINLWIDLGDYEKAAALSGRIKNDLEKSPDGLLSLARLNVQLSKIPQALEEARQALKLDPYNLEARALIEANSADPDYFLKRIDELKAKLDADPQSLTLKIEMASTLLHLAQSSQQKRSQELTSALTLLFEVLPENQDIPRVYTLVGKTYFLLDNFLDALKSLQNAVKLNISDIEAYKILGNVFERMQNYDQAVVAAMEAIKYAPNDAEAWEELAQISAKNGNHIDAINYLLNAIRFKPNDPRPYIDLGSLYYEAVSYEEAESTLEKALHIAPDNIEALKLLYIILNDPNLMLNEKKDAMLEEKQKSILEKIQNLDPQAAEELKKRFKKELP